MHEETFTQHLGSLKENIINILANIAHLFKLEYKLAKFSIFIIIGLTIVFGILTLSTWLFLLASLFIILTEIGMSSVIALLLIVGLNIVLALLTSLTIINLYRNLFFTATRRQITILKTHITETE